MAKVKEQKANRLEWIISMAILTVAVMVREYVNRNR